MSECHHPECCGPADPRARSKSRCLCYDCLLRRDGILGDAIGRMVAAVESGTLAQIMEHAEDLDRALWRTAPLPATDDAKGDQ